MLQMLLANVHATKQGSAFTNELICSFNQKHRMHNSWFL